MNGEPSWSAIQAHLDGQLDGALVASLETSLRENPDLAARFDAQRRFHAFLRRALADVLPPPGFEERIHARLGEAVRHAEVGWRRLLTRTSSVLHRTWFRAAACVVLAAAGLVAYQTVCVVGMCRYIDACCTEHGLVLAGTPKLELASQDARALTGFVTARLERPIASAPALSKFGLHAVGAGRADFRGLRAVGAPAAVFIEYVGDRHPPVTLILHKWPFATPSVSEVEFAGRRFWCAEHRGYCVACWKAGGGELLCSVVAQLPRAALLPIALAAREGLEPAP